MKSIIPSFVVALSAGGITSLPVHGATPEETRAIASEAWTYAFPMMENDNSW